MALLFHLIRECKLILYFPKGRDVWRGKGLNYVNFKIDHIYIFIMMLVYIIYELTIGLVFCLFREKIKYTKIKLKILSEKAWNNPRVIRDISLATFVNGLFSVANVTSFLGFVGYGLLTIIALIGIINADNKIEEK